MAQFDLSINYKDLPQGVSKQQHSFNLIVKAVTQKFSDSLNVDERTIYAGIYNKLVKMISDGVAVVDFNSAEKDFIKNCFISTAFTVSESPDISKLENKFS